MRSYLQGNGIVYGVRNDRSSDTPFKRTTAQAFYGLLNLMGVEAVYNHADYRLMSKRALDALALDGEVNLFLRAWSRWLDIKARPLDTRGMSALRAKAIIRSQKRYRLLLRV